MLIGGIGRYSVVICFPGSPSSLHQNNISVGQTSVRFITQLAKMGIDHKFVELSRLTCLEDLLNCLHFDHNRFSRLPKNEIPG